MKKEYFLIVLFLGLTALIFYLFYRLLIPFFVPLAWAAIFTIISYPLYEWAGRWLKSPTWRALLMTALMVILIVGPITYLGVALVQEATAMFTRFTDWVDTGKLAHLDDFKNWSIYLDIQNRLAPYVDLSQLDLRVIIEKALKTTSGVALSQATQILTNVGRVLFHFVLMVFFMFFFFRDGENLFQQIKSIIPLPPDKTDAIVENLKEVVSSVMRGSLFISLLQGFLGGLLFLIMGLPSPVFWGAMMAFLVFVPIVGAFLVYIPAGLILIFTGSLVKGILLIAISALVIGQIDYFLRPLLMSHKTGLHTMLLFLSIMGGVVLFGLLGIVLGPLIAAVFVSLFDILRFKLTEDEYPTSHSEPE